MLVSIEGIDGSGKRTQSLLLQARAEQAGLSATVVSFPRYGQTRFAHTITEYLNGSRLDMGSTSARYTALLYAGDRFESREWLDELCGSHDLVILDRYVGSNLAYQGAKVDADQRPDLLSWIANIEYDVYGLTPADVNILFDVPLAISSELVNQKTRRTYTDKQQDLHEANGGYLARCQEVYRWMAEREDYGRWVTINCIDDAGQMRSTEAICDQAWHELGISKEDDLLASEMQARGRRQA